MGTGAGERGGRSGGPAESWPLLHLWLAFSEQEAIKEAPIGGSVSSFLPFQRLLGRASFQLARSASPSPAPAPVPHASQTQLIPPIRIPPLPTIDRRGLLRNRKLDSLRGPRNPQLPLMRTIHPTFLGIVARGWPM